MNTKVVILNWNGREHLLKFLPSVVETVPEGVGVVVADNGSTDDSIEILRSRFSGVEVVRLDRNYGFAGGYNRALSIIEADYFILLNSDVMTSPGWVEPLIETLAGDSRIMAVAPKILSYLRPEYFEYAGACGGFIDKYGYPFCRGRILNAIEKDNGQYDDPRGVFWASGACMACRRELFTEVGGFDEDFFAHMEEIDLCWRAQLYGYTVAVEPRSVVYHLGGGTLPNNSPRKIYLNYRNNLFMLYKNLPTESKGITLFMRKVLDGLSAMCYLFTGRWSFFVSVLKAHMDFYKNLDSYRDKRAEILTRTIAASKYIYPTSIIVQYFLIGRRTFSEIIGTFRQNK